MHHSYIIIHNTHETFEVALFVNARCHKMIVDDKRHASKQLVSYINTLLQDSQLSLNTISFVGINQGPGLFSTLRSIIATANGLYFASNIPLIGIDALDATLSEFCNSLYPNTIVLLDACNKEVYYAISCNNTITAKGYDNIYSFLKSIKTHYASIQFRFIGKGTVLYKDVILDAFKSDAIIPDDIPLLCSVNTIADLSYRSFMKKPQGQGYLFPLHLKKHPVER